MRELGKPKDLDGLLTSTGWAIRKKPLSEALPSMRNFLNSPLSRLKVSLESTIFYRSPVKLVHPVEFFLHRHCTELSVDAIR